MLALDIRICICIGIGIRDERPDEFARPACADEAQIIVDQVDVISWTIVSKITIVITIIAESCESAHVEQGAE